VPKKPHNSDRRELERPAMIACGFTASNLKSYRLIMNLILKVEGFAELND
jgi:hypothetical protein